jgi:hypothetical protein
MHEYVQAILKKREDFENKACSDHSYKEVKLSRADSFVVIQVGFDNHQNICCRPPEVMVGNRRRWFGDCHKTILNHSEHTVKKEAIHTMIAFWVPPEMRLTT